MERSTSVSVSSLGGRGASGGAGRSWGSLTCFHFIGDGMEAQRGYGPNVAQLVAMLGIKNKDQVGNFWE